MPALDEDPARPSIPPVSAAGVGIPAAPESGILAWFPGLWVLKNYRRSWLGRDLTAGLVLTALLVPAGMGYAEASGLPAITGLYATVAPLLAYALFGPSRIMVLGPDSALAPPRGGGGACPRRGGPSPCGRAGFSVGSPDRRHVRARWPSARRVRHRSALAAGSRGLHERYRADRTSDTAPQTVRLLQLGS